MAVLLVISPPFLPAPIAGESDAAWLDRAFCRPCTRALNVDATSGSFPVSSSLMWHTGLHLVAPHEDRVYQPARAVADGKVIYLRRPTQRTSAPEHGLNYSPNGEVQWTDDGCVILEHST